MSLEKEIKEFKIILKNTKKESNPNPFEQRLLRKVIKLIQELQTAKEENKKLNKLHAFLHNKFNWSKEDVWIRNYLSSYIFDEEMVSDGKEYISPLKQILDLTQQNKQMRDEISEIRNMINPDRSWESFDEWEQYIYKAVDKIDKLQQALKEVNNEK